MDHRKYNARQLILKFKGAHGAGQNLEYPNADDINQKMEGTESDYMVNIYGDGSLTSPTKWWAALGGFGVWIPDWNEPGQDHDHKKEAS